MFSLRFLSGCNTFGLQVHPGVRLRSPDLGVKLWKTLGVGVGAVGAHTIAGCRGQHEEQEAEA